MTRRMTDAEIALHENALGPDAEFMSPATLASTGLLLLEELRVERERCAEFEELAIRRWAWLIQHGIDPDTGKEKFRKACLRCDSFGSIAKALKETE